MRWALIVMCVLIGAVACPLQADQVGVWQFDNDLNNGLSGGAPMAAVGGWTPTYVNETIGGSPATVLAFPAMTSSQALDMPNEAGPNGPGTTTTEIWSIVMDVKFTTIGNYMSLWETDDLGTGDGDYFARDTEGIGTSNVYSGEGTYDPAVWNRIAVTIDPLETPSTYTLNGYIDGVWAVKSTTSSPPDGKEAVRDFLHLFADESGETAAGLVNSVAYYDEILSANAIGLLGGASAAGIPAIPEPTSLVLAGLALLGLSWRRHSRMN